MTVAPADADASKYLYIGKVAHITAAATGGPRYDASIAGDERRAATNAIFLCSACADLIDRNGGADFPVTQLRDWKDQHERWIRENLNRRIDSPLATVDGAHEAAGVGDIVALDIQGPAIIKPGTISRASGFGSVTATRIGRAPKD
jgi:hypothetical protein